jgi:hypothetical protein
VNEISMISVEREARSIARRTFSGSRKNIYQKEQHVVNAAELIRKRWDVAPKNWQAKHLRWFFEVALVDKSSGTRYRYYRYLRDALIEINKWDDVGKFLTGSWINP